MYMTPQSLISSESAPENRFHYTMYITYMNKYEVSPLIKILYSSETQPMNPHTSCFN